MKRITIHIADEQHQVLQDKANSLTGGNISAMVRWMFDQFVMPHEYQVHAARMERLMRVLEAKQKHQCGGQCKCKS